MLGDFQGSFKVVPGKILACFKEVLRVFQGRLQGASMEFKWVSKVWKEVQWVVEGSFKGVSRMF